MAASSEHPNSDAAVVPVEAAPRYRLWLLMLFLAVRSIIAVFVIEGFRVRVVGGFRTRNAVAKMVVVALLPCCLIPTWVMMKKTKGTNKTDRQLTMEAEATAAVRRAAFFVVAFSAIVIFDLALHLCDFSMADDDVT